MVWESADPSRKHARAQLTAGSTDDGTIPYSGTAAAELHGMSPLEEPAPSQQHPPTTDHHSPTSPWTDSFSDVQAGTFSTVNFIVEPYIKISIQRAGFAPAAVGGLIGTASFQLQPVDSFYGGLQVMTVGFLTGSLSSGVPPFF